MIGSCRPKTATPCRSGQGVSELTDSSPIRCALRHELGCGYLRELTWTTLNPVRDFIACRIRFVDCGSLPRWLGAIATASHGRAKCSGGFRLHGATLHIGGCSRGACQDHASDHGSVHFRVTRLRMRRNIGPNGAISPAGEFIRAPLTANIERARLITGANYEKRNADQCPPTGGKPDCHR